ncbi:PEP-CTERM sorting domain-containing protein [Cerasicoccus fimbriatus]|uniref:PEP-CTERM sorting domain-containing protein n=1 Tax=Cerasicoccus fimbriatus TaxID=3014554 RepID=UPI0022B4C60B|nr:PEP-CTERM sorting domain-containing protein [Cerasicoccus sp. TK19100]
MKITFAASLLAALVAPILGQAALTMSIDNAAKTITFGNTSDSGTPTGPTGALAYWQLDAVYATATGNTLDISDALLTDGTPAGNAEVDLNATGTQYLALSVFEGTPYTDISGTGVAVSYSSLDPALQAGLENLAASNAIMPLELGSGFADVTMNLVPEPSIYAGLIAFGTLSLVVYWRRRHKRMHYWD